MFSTNFVRKLKKPTAFWPNVSKPSTKIRKLTTDGPWLSAS